ncbi:uncharacterized protein [Triticum aestivum]|uniref:uncharacterized protein n=1 Tax=Triticum aestivum TaxID=4565 RepID=UPI001D02547A|nr:uncharacterized protein LOC123081263 [Triticum aestivum]
MARLWIPEISSSIPTDSCCCPLTSGVRATGSGRPCLVSGHSGSGFVFSRIREPHHYLTCISSPSISVVDFTGCSALVELSLSEARDLELSANSDVVWSNGSQFDLVLLHFPWTVFHMDLKWCPTFTKLKTLLLNDWCLAADHNALICFLQHSPILEKLTLQLSRGPSYVTEAEGIYKPLGQSIASNCLEIVEIKCANIDSRVHKILKILTTYGILLEQISVQETYKIPGSGCFNFVCTGFCYNCRYEVPFQSSTSSAHNYLLRKWIKMDVSRTKIGLNTSISPTSYSGWKEYNATLLEYWQYLA